MLNLPHFVIMLSQKDEMLYYRHMRKNKTAENVIESIFVVLLVLALVAILLLQFSEIAGVVYADGESYIEAPVSDLKNNPSAGKSVIALSTDDETFYIPESYYVKLGENQFADTYKCLYLGEEFFITTENPTLIALPANASQDPAVSLTLKDSETEVINGITVDNTFTIRFAGYSEDLTKIFVIAEKDGEKALGFIAKNKLTDFTVPYESLKAAEREALLNENNFDPNEELPASTSKGIRIAIIVCLAVAAVVIFTCFFVPSKKKSNKLKQEDGKDYDSSKKYEN